LDTVGAAYAGVADGQLSAGQAAVAIAAVAGQDAEAVRAAVLGLVRECAAGRLLVAVD
jgi:hypothetical protein